MILIVCLDDKNGMAFNRRRQSQDALAREKLLSLAGGAPSWMNAYSAKQFGEAPSLRVEEDFLAKAGPGEYAFAEFPPLAPYAKAVERICVIRWNRAYPADAKLDIPLQPGLWDLVKSEDFPGSSHDKLTLEIYER
ncbi:MAG: ribonuclease Z [Oscillibacter sp.]|nr:ribonuclease Z [Oscillibacter sp.]